MLESDGPDDPASSGGPSTCAGIARIADAADQTAGPEHHNRGISHALSSCMRITSSPETLCVVKSSVVMRNLNRISLPIPKL